MCMWETRITNVNSDATASLTSIADNANGACTFPAGRVTTNN